MTMLRVPSKGASSDTQGEKQTRLQQDHVHALSTKEVDTGAQFVAGLSTELDPAEAARVRKKIDYHILPMMCTLYWIQFMDKTTLGSAAILGIERKFIDQSIQLARNDILHQLLHL
jgi:ACS family allantoate permease-like MFS transporter